MLVVRVFKGIRSLTSFIEAFYSTLDFPSFIEMQKSTYAREGVTLYALPFSTGRSIFRTHVGCVVLYFSTACKQ